MRMVAWMVIGSVGSALLVIGIVGRRTMREVVLGMVAPLVAAATSWLLIERTHRRHPKRLTSLMLSAFAAKVVWFGAYVIVMLAVVGLRPGPFVVSFLGYFITLYVFEALLMRRLFASEGK